MARQSDRQTSAKPGPGKPSDRRSSRSGFVPLYVPFLFPLPALLLIVFRYYPRFSAVHHSFTIREIPQPGEFVGLQNYRALAGDPVFSKSVSNILKFMLGRTTLALVMAFIGVARACPWLGRPITALLALICIGSPPLAGFGFLVILAALQNLSSEVNDALQGVVLPWTALEVIIGIFLMRTS